MTLERVDAMETDTQPFDDTATFDQEQTGKRRSRRRSASTLSPAREAVDSQPGDRDGRVG